MEQDVFQFVKAFVSIIWEAFPFVVLGAIFAGILEEVVPQQAIAKIVPKNTLLAVCIGAVLGLVFPMCECGIVPVMRRLLRKGLPLGTCVAYMLAGPIINLIVIGSTWVAFFPHGIGPEIVGLRVGLGFIVAVTTASIVQAQYRVYGNRLLTPMAAPVTDERGMLEAIEGTPIHPSVNRAGESRPLFQRLANISEAALHDFVDIMVFLTLGACLAGALKVWGPTADDLQAMSEGYPALTILVMMFMAIAMCLCSEADAFVAASFTTMHPSAKVAFLVLGPMFDLKLLLMFTRVFRRRLIVTIVVTVFIQVFVYSMAVHYLWTSIVAFVGAITPVVIVAVPILAVVVFLALYVRFLLSIRRILAAISEPNREFAPRRVWLGLVLIPGLSQILMALIVIWTAKSLRREFRDRGWETDGEGFGLTSGLLWALGSPLLALFPVVLGSNGSNALDGLAGLLGFVFWVTYWYQIATYGERLRVRPTESGSSPLHELNAPNTGTNGA